MVSETVSEAVKVEMRNDGCRLALTLVRPRQRNAITAAMYSVLVDAITHAATDPAVRVITIEGEGEDFTAGNDLADFLNDPPPSDEAADVPVWRLLRALADNEVPLVAAVQGHAVGIGTTMLLHCDLVVAEQGARFVLPFVDLGLVPEAASSLILPAIAGRRAAARYLLLGEPFGVDEALAMGVISHVARAGTLGTRLDDIVTALLAKPVEALRQTQRLLRAAHREEIIERMTLENGRFAERLASDEVKRLITAFFAARARAQTA